VTGVLIVLAAVTIRVLVLRDRSQAVPVDVARDRYRSAVAPADGSAGAASTAPRSGTPQPAHDQPLSPVAATALDTVPDVVPAVTPSLVAPGVYRYRTTGEESIDVLGGATHRYPDETTITVVPDGCGVLLRWDALVERHDEWRLCATPSGIERQPVGLQYHEFFGRGEREDLVCDRPVLLVPATWTSPPPPAVQSCTLGEDPWLPTWQAVTRTERRVAGEAVDVVHVRMEIADDDEYWERTVVDWFLAADGLPVEVTAVKESRSPSPIGAVEYRETYRLELLSRVPLT
jgi:hypothetical protein